MILWLLLSRLENGGLEKVQFHLAGHFAECGHEVRIVAGQVLAEPSEPLPLRVGIDEFARQGRVRVLPGLVHALRRDRPDVIFATSIDLACLLLFMRKIHVGSWRVVVTQHSLASAPRKAARGLQRLKWETVRWASRLLIDDADALVSVSTAVAEDMQKEFSTTREIEVIPNPVLTPRFVEKATEKASWPWPDQSVPAVIFVGRLAVEKRLDVLFEAFRLLLGQRAARLLVVGTGPLSTQVTQWAQDLELGDAVRLVGSVSNPLPLIKQSNVLVLPSDHEGFGMVLVEAMACCTQVIATQGSGGPEDILEGGRYGLLVPRGDTEALASAMAQVLRGEWQVHAEALTQRASRFDLRRSASAYQQLLNRITDH